MFKIIKIFVCLSFSLMGHAGLMNDFPIVIDCHDDSPSPTTKLVVALSPEKNDAVLFFKTNEMAEADIVGIDSVFGIYSSTTLKIERYSGGMHGEQNLKIDANMSEVLRVHTYANFVLNMKKNAQGNFSLLDLKYAAGKDAFPDTQIENSLVFENFVCSVTGL
jgi:hypothetical protein